MYILELVLSKASLHYTYYPYLFICVPMQERLDFSCALFGPDGGLVANAPHIPVHLGAMQEAVQWQVYMACVYMWQYYCC